VAPALSPRRESLRHTYNPDDSYLGKLHAKFKH
jgi:hypothetical protein